jgi:hypothetical protein
MLLSKLADSTQRPSGLKVTCDSSSSGIDQEKLTDKRQFRHSQMTAPSDHEDHM